MIVLCGLVVAAAAFLSWMAQAQLFPAKLVRIIVAFPAGDASDPVGRIIQPAMADLLEQQVAVDNRGGGAGNIGVDVAVRATPPLTKTLNVRFSKY